MNLRRACIAILLCNLVAALEIGKVPSSLPWISSEFHLNLVRSSLILSALNLVAAIGSGAVPSLVRRLGSRAVVAGGLSLIAVCSGLGAAAVSSQVLLLTRVGEGFGCLLVMVSGPSLLARVVGGSALRFWTGMWPGAVPVGTAIMLIVAPTISQATSWRMVWVVTAAISLIAAAALLSATRGLPGGLHPTNTPGAADTRGRIWTQLRSFPVVCACLVCGIYSAMFMGILGLLPVMLVQDGSQSPLSAGMLTAGGLFVNAGISSFCGWLQFRGAPGWRFVLSAGLVFLPCFWVIYMPSSPLALSVAAVWIFTGAGGMIPAALLGTLVRHARSPLEVAAGVALMNQFLNGGQLLGPPALASAAGWAWFWVPVCLSCMAAMVVALALTLRRIDGVVVPPGLGRVLGGVTGAQPGA